MLQSGVCSNQEVRLRCNPFLPSFVKAPHLVSTVVAEVQLSLMRVESHAWCLRHHLEVDSFIRLHSDHQLITLHLTHWEDVTCHIPELQPHFRFAFIKSWKKKGILCELRRMQTYIHIF